MRTMSDYEYMAEAKAAATESRCRKKQLGCVLKFTDGSYIQGTNGVPEPLQLCTPCPRLDSHGGTDLHLCRAVHAERQVLLKAAKCGFATEDSVLYSYMGVPCTQCILELIEAGISEIVCFRETYYDELSKEVLQEWIGQGGIFRVMHISHYAKKCMEKLKTALDTAIGEL